MSSLVTLSGRVRSRDLNDCQLCEVINFSLS